MEKVAVFLDYANLERSSRAADCEINYKSLLDYLANPEENRFLQAAFAYVPINPRQEHARDFAINQLWEDGFVVKSKVGTIAGDSYKCDYDVEITLDMTKTVFEMKPDIVVLVSGDSDFTPLVLELRNKGIRVEVASFGNSMSSLLRNRCSGFIDLDLLSEEPQEEEAFNKDSDYEDLFNQYFYEEDNQEHERGKEQSSSEIEQDSDSSNQEEQSSDSKDAHKVDSSRANSSAGETHSQSVQEDNDSNDENK